MRRTVPATCVLLFVTSMVVDPAAAGRGKAAPAGLPKVDEHWDPIGDFKLQDQGKERLVKLYYRDTDSVAWKQMKKEGVGAFRYPNSFDLHALYQDGSAKWHPKPLYGVARVRFVKVQKATPEAVVLQLCGNLMVYRLPGEDLDKALERTEKANRPFTLTVRFSGGLLVAREGP
jgi:hypothetical protein